ncbi:hypothetical protein BHE74_00022194 [Ensete ventricosum]|nr:hypothetical protein GW17_00046164 [Ensete ventricosum]RWW70143.1 hypothetical protein BHE74_00022194 [Ensete ventricosum]RZR79507.1 hypothetical protein BHM03_00005237 [Ensete ventricosum]
MHHLPVVGLEEGAAEGADDGPPGLTMNGDVAEPRGGHHVGGADAATAARADPGRRLAAPHRPPLVHQKAEERHLLCLSSLSWGKGEEEREEDMSSAATGLADKKKVEEVGTV